MIHYFTGALAFIACLPVLITYGRLALSARGVARHMALGSFWFAGSYGWRTFYWDILRPLVDPDTWDAWYAVTETGPNIGWNLLIILGGYHSAKALHLMIPAEDRHRFSIWNAWIYPPWRLRFWR